jgi:hypothetical protein
MRTQLDKSKFVEDFLQKLHAGEYSIDHKANEIQYDDIKTVAGALDFALSNYDYVISHSLLGAYPNTIDDAYKMITTAFTFGVVIYKHDVRIKLKQTEELLTRCEEDKARLENDNRELLHKLTDCQQLKETLEEQMLNHSITHRDDEDET